uniref:Uncharacterized protein n=1 Tax=Ralstonia solanacearum TaxID=305 RepID=A0A0S4U457_RALSL|nr:protein of unknown function [Ralstonia solanacearum]
MNKAILRGGLFLLLGGIDIPLGGKYRGHGERTPWFAQSAPLYGFLSSYNTATDACNVLERKVVRLQADSRWLSSPERDLLKARLSGRITALIGC